MMLKSMLSIIDKNFTILNNLYITFELYIIYLFNIYTQNVKLIQYINYKNKKKKKSLRRGSEEDMKIYFINKKYFLKNNYLTFNTKIFCKRSILWKNKCSMQVLIFGILT